MSQMDGWTPVLTVEIVIAIAETLIVVVAVIALMLSTSRFLLEKEKNIITI